MRRSRRASIFSGVALATLATCPALSATPSPNLTWTTATSTSWSVGPWLPAVPAYGGSSTIVPQFNNTTGTSYTASNDLGATFALSGMFLNATSAGTISIANAAGNSLRFVNNGLDFPLIQQSGSAAAAITAPLRIATGLTIGGAGGGNLTLSGLISGSGSMSVDRSTGTTIFSGTNRHTGGTTLTNGTLQIGSGFALGSGSLTVNGGMLRPTGSSVLNVFNPIITNGSLTLQMSSAARIHARGDISGSAGVRNAGLGQLYLAGNNTYGGSTLIEATTASTTTEILFDSNSNLGAASTPVVFKDSTFGAAISALTYIGTGSIALSRPISIQGSSEARITPIESNATVVLNGGVSGDGDLRVGLYNFGGVVELAGANTYSGETWVTTGTLRFDADARLGNSQFVVLDGGCLMPKGDWFSTRSVSINQQTNATLGTIKSSGLNTDIYTVSLSGLDYTVDGLSDLTLYKSGSGTLQLAGLTAPSLVSDAGNIILHGTGTSSFTSATLSTVIVNRGGGFILDNSTTNLANRLPNGGTISMNGGSFTLRGNALAISSETVGAINLGTSSFNVIDVQPALAPAAQLTASSLVNSGGAGVLFRGPALGVTSTVNFTSSPTLTGAGGIAGTPDVSIIRGAFGDDTATGLGSGFVTTTAGSVRLLAPTEYEGTIVSGAVTNRNVSLSSPLAGINSSTTINSLRLLNGSNISGGGLINITSGMVLVPAGNTATIGVATIGTTGSMHVRNNGTLSLWSRVSAGTLNLSGNGVTTAMAEVSGAISIHEGTLRSGAMELIGDAQVVSINESGTWDLNGMRETVAGLTQQNIATVGAGSYGTVNVNAGTLHLTPASGTTNIFSGRFTGGGRIIKSGTGSIVFNGQHSDFTGVVEIQQGVLRLNSLATSVPHGSPAQIPAESRLSADGDDVLACSTVNFNVSGVNSAELKLSDKISNFSRPIVVDGATSGTLRFTTRNDTTISSNITLNRNLQIGSASAIFSGNIGGPGSLTIVHPDPAAVGYVRPPITTITGSNSYTGTTMVGGGTVIFTSDVANGSNSAFGNATSAIILGDSNAAGALGSEISGVTQGTTMHRPIISGSGTGSINLSSRSTTGSVTFGGTITLNRAAFLFSTMNQVTDRSVGSVNFTGKITGSAAITIGGTDAFSGQPRSWSHVILASSTSDYSGGTTVTAGSLGFGASSSGGTGPAGVAPLTLGAAGAEIPIIYAHGAPRSVHNSITLNNHVIFAGSEPLTFTGPVGLGSAERILYAEASATVRLGGLVGGSGSLSKDGPGTLTLGSTNTYSGPTGVFDGTLVLDASQTPSALNIGSGAKVIVSAGANKVLRTANLRMVDGAVLDLTDEDAILDYTAGSVLNSTRSQIISGFNIGNWNGSGIRSSIAAGATSPTTGLGYAEASVVLGGGGGTFSGASVDGTTVLIRYTALGDANLNGTVDSTDFGFFTAGYGKLTNALWTEGDFNYDGKVNTLDFNELAGNFGFTVPAPLPAAPGLGSIVPEPASAMLLTTLAYLLRRRRTA